LTEPKSFKDGKQWAWDSTSLSSAQTCLRKYQYEMIRRIQPRRTSVHLIFGGIYASALEAFYKYRAEGLDHEAALTATVRLTLEKSWDFEENKPVYFDDVKKTRPNLVRTVIWYIEQYGVESEDGLTTYHLADGKPAVELSFSIELDENVVFCGHLDRVVQLGDDLYIADQKTTGGTISNYFFKQFDTSLQMTGYAFAGKMVLKTPVRGVIIDGAQVAVNFTQYERGITTRSQDQIEDWLKSVEHTIQSAWRAADEDYYPMNYTSCDKYGGCPFRQLCTSSKHVVENYIRSEYETRVWDPIVQR
jgi:hypothetical protein